MQVIQLPVQNKQQELIITKVNFSYSNIINVSLTYLRGLELTELKEEDMPMV